MKTASQNTGWLRIKSFDCSVPSNHSSTPLSQLTRPCIAYNNNYSTISLYITNLCATTNTNLIRPFIKNVLFKQCITLHTKFTTSHFIFKCKRFTSEHVIKIPPLHYSTETRHSSYKQPAELYAASFVQPQSVCFSTICGVFHH